MKTKLIFANTDKKGSNNIPPLQLDKLKKNKKDYKKGKSTIPKTPLIKREIKLPFNTTEEIKNWFHFIVNEKDLKKIESSLNEQTGSLKKAPLHYLAEKSVVREKLANNFLVMLFKSLRENQKYTPNNLLDLLKIADKKGNTPLHYLNHVEHLDEIINFFLKFTQKKIISQEALAKVLFSENSEGNVANVLTRYKETVKLQ